MQERAIMITPAPIANFALLFTNSLATFIAKHERGAYGGLRFLRFAPEQAELHTSRPAGFPVSFSRRTQPRTPGAPHSIRLRLARRDGSSRGKPESHDRFARLVVPGSGRSGSVAVGLGFLPACPSPKCGTPAADLAPLARSPEHYPGKRLASAGK